MLSRSPGRSGRPRKPGGCAALRVVWAASRRGTGDPPGAGGPPHRRGGGDAETVMSTIGWLTPRWGCWPEREPEDARMVPTARDLASIVHGQLVAVNVADSCWTYGGPRREAGAAGAKGCVVRWSRIPTNRCTGQPLVRVGLLRGPTGRGAGARERRGSPRPAGGPPRPTTLTACRRTPPQKPLSVGRRSVAPRRAAQSGWRTSDPERWQTAGRLGAAGSPLRPLARSAAEAPCQADPARGRASSPRPRTSSYWGGTAGRETSARRFGCRADQPQIRQALLSPKTASVHGSRSSQAGVAGRGEAAAIATARLDNQ